MQTLLDSFEEIARVKKKKQDVKISKNRNNTRFITNIDRNIEFCAQTFYRSYVSQRER